MGVMFYRNQPVSEIKAMKFRELKYWASWHEKLEQAKINAYTTPTQ